MPDSSSGDGPFLTDEEIRGLCREQLKRYPNLAALAPGGWPARHITIAGLDEVRDGYEFLREDSIDLPIVLVALGTVDPPVDARVKTVIDGALWHLDWFCKVMKGIPGAETVIAPLFRDLSPGGFWAVVSETMVARRIHTRRGRILGFGKAGAPIPGTRNDADILFEERGQRHYLDIEAKATRGLDGVKDIDAAVAAINYAGLTKASKKFVGALNDGSKHSVCLVWRLSPGSMELTNGIDRASVTATDVVGDVEVGIFHFRTALLYREGAGAMPAIVPLHERVNLTPPPPPAWEKPRR